MGSKGGSGPNGLVRRETSTAFLRAPAADWASLVQGLKTEFRMPWRSDVTKRILPTIVVLYTWTPATGTKCCLKELYGYKDGRLIDIAKDTQALHREGFWGDLPYDEFRRYWRARTKRPYDPTQRVAIAQIAPLTPKRALRAGLRLIDHLYGSYADLNLPDV
jgi:hypothetical protein